MQTCPSCGEENPDRFRLCGICGTKLAPEEVASEVRKTVTVVFTDLKGSTTLGEQLDTESLREALNIYFNEMRAVLERHGGTVQKYIGDAIMAVFGLPKLHEDDALRAVRAAHEMREALGRVNDRLDAGWGVRLQNRTGVYTGEVVAGDVSAGQHLVTGDAANTAARLEQNAPTDQVLIGEATYRLVRDAVEVEPVEPLELKGKAEPMPAYVLLSVTGEEGVARRHDAPIVGRDRELMVLAEALERSESQRRAQLVTVFGPAGVGKSRLLLEFLRRARDRVDALRGRCLSYGDGITFLPLAEVVRQAAGIAEDDSRDEARARLATLAPDAHPDVIERVAAAIGLSDDSFPVHETFWAARRLIEALVHDRPTVILIDDIHWAEDTFLDLLHHLADTTEAPLVLLCSARPELLEDHAEWVQETDHRRRITLEPLSPEESARVVENLLGSTDLDEAIRTRIIQGAEGNPLFVEQLLSMLIDDGILARDPDGRWVVVGDAGALQVPPTISSLLTARLDRLGATERAVIERGAVIGQEFFRGAVEHLSPASIRPYAGPALQQLVRKELVRPKGTGLAGEDTFRFLHGLIRDSAYQGLLKRVRAELHESFVEWLERAAADRAKEYEEIRGYHLEQAYLIRAQLGPIDEHGRELGIRGSEDLAAAGRRALSRGDMPAAAGLLRRAAALRPSGDRKRAELFLLAGEAMIETGDLVLAKATLAAAAQEAVEAGDRALEVTTHLAALWHRYTTDPESTESEVVREVESAIPILEKLGGHAGLARAWRLLVHVHGSSEQSGAVEQAATKMAEQARLAGDDVLEARARPTLAQCAVYGPTRVTDGIRRCERLLEQAENDRKVEALTSCAIAHLEAMQGNLERARTLYREGRATFEELGWSLHAAMTSIDSGPVELLAGDPEAAEAELRRDYEALERMGERNYISTTAGLLAEALYRQERIEEAQRFADVCREVAAEDDVASQSIWRVVTARILARQGDIDRAIALVRESLALTSRTDNIDALGHCHQDFADVLLRAGRTEEARAELEASLRYFEAKGNEVAAGKVRLSLSTLSGIPSEAAQITPG